MEGNIYRNSTDRQNQSPMKEKRMNSKDASSVAEQEDADDLLGGGGADYDMRKRAATGGAVGKRGSAVGGGGSAMKTCQAERCSADLNEAKSYHRRHKVCEHHFKAQAVVVAGIRQRFCQQCSRFHELSEFDEAKRSCRRRLACHNERRRKNFADNNNNSQATTDDSATGYRQVADRGRIQFAIQESANY